MTTIEVNTNEIKNRISPMLYGIFFEDINYGGDGGLYAELVANRSFEYYDRDNVVDKHKMCWEALKGTKFEIATEEPINQVHTHYAAVSGKAGCGIRNEGFCKEGFSTGKGERFRFSCYMKGEKDTRVRAVISDKADRVLACHEFLCKGREWQRYECELVIAEHCESAYISLVMPEGGAVELEFISLFPKDTFRGRENGMRKDIAEKIKNLKPAFMRFPGGCIVEGRSFPNMYRWKDTIGAVETRGTNWNRWQMEEYQNLGYDASDYFQSYGIGFYEYFLFCEDIGAKPVPVVNCGMTCQWHEGLLIDLDKLEPFIQDVFDLIEFANGDEASEWGKKRIEMGHREPFYLEYIGIGNEQWGKEYFERYEIFEKRIAEKYPQIKLVTSAGWKNRGWEFEFAYDWMEKNKEKAYAVDEHFYKEPEWFLQNTGRYDKYDRSLPKVFIGEYAAHTAEVIEDRKNNWYAALAEAAFLTGVENNADHVVMTCYAPLLARQNHQQWQPDLIWFDKENVYGTPSYYVQQLFAEYLGEYAVEAVCTDESIRISAALKEDRLILKMVNVSGKSKKVKLSVDEDYRIEKVMYIHAGLTDENSMDNPECVRIRNYENEDNPECVQIRDYENEDNPECVQIRNYENEDNPECIQIRNYENENNPECVQIRNYENEDNPECVQRKNCENENQPQMEWVSEKSEQTDRRVTDGTMQCLLKEYSVTVAVLKRRP